MILGVEGLSADCDRANIMCYVAIPRVGTYESFVVDAERDMSAMCMLCSLQ